MQSDIIHESCTLRKKNHSNDETLQTIHTYRIESHSPTKLVIWLREKDSKETPCVEDALTDQTWFTSLIINQGVVLVIINLDPMFLFDSQSIQENRLECHDLMNAIRQNLVVMFRNRPQVQTHHAIIVAENIGVMCVLRAQEQSNLWCRYIIGLVLASGVYDLTCVKCFRPHLWKKWVKRDPDMLSLVHQVHLPVPRKIRFQNTIVIHGIQNAYHPITHCWQWLVKNKFWNVHPKQRQFHLFFPTVHHVDVSDICQMIVPHLRKWLSSVNE